MKKFLMLLFCLAALNCAYAAVNPCDINDPCNAALKPVTLNLDWWLPRHNAVLERNRQGNVNIIMVGDSITHRWEDAGKDVWQKYYASRNTVNMGFGGDGTQHVLWRLEHGEVNNINPKLAVLMIGTNNSNRNDYTAEQIAEGVKSIICQLRTCLPNTKILVLGIFPRGDARQRKDKALLEASYNPQWEKNDTANKIISKVADNKTIYYLNINKKFLTKKGKLTRDIMPDLLHLNQKGYEIWAKAMEPMIVKLTGGKK
ncbi:MAG: GDSL-type esterase/lipase family protein [Phycisphaerae bacterium]|jgi:beta-glucosidase